MMFRGSFRKAATGGTSSGQQADYVEPAASVFVSDVTLTAVYRREHRVYTYSEGLTL